MSSYNVSDAHIDFLITAGIKINNNRSVAWRTESGAAEVLTAANADETGRMLIDQNIAAVDANYGDSGETSDSYNYTPSKVELDAVRIFKALDGFEYQCCGRKEFYESNAYEFCVALRKLAGQSMPGYDAADWDIN